LYNACYNGLNTCSNLKALQTRTYIIVTPGQTLAALGDRLSSILFYWLL